MAFVGDKRKEPEVKSPLMECEWVIKPHTWIHIPARGEMPSVLKDSMIEGAMEGVIPSVKCSFALMFNRPWAYMARRTPIEDVGIIVGLREDDHYIAYGTYIHQGRECVFPIPLGVGDADSQINLFSAFIVNIGDASMEEETRWFRIADSLADLCMVAGLRVASSHELPAVVTDGATNEFLHECLCKCSDCLRRCNDCVVNDDLKTCFVQYQALLMEVFVKSGKNMNMGAIWRAWTKDKGWKVCDRHIWELDLYE